MDSNWIRTGQQNHPTKRKLGEFPPHRIHVWYIYLHGWLIFMVNVGIYTIHGSYGHNTLDGKTPAPTAAICWLKIPVFSRLFGASLLCRFFLHPPYDFLLCRFFLHPPYDLQFSVLIKTVVSFAVLRSLLDMESRKKRVFVILLVEN